MLFILWRNEIRNSQTVCRTPGQFSITSARVRRDMFDVFKATLQDRRGSNACETCCIYI